MNKLYFFCFCILISAKLSSQSVYEKLADTNIFSKCKNNLILENSKFKQSIKNGFTLILDNKKSLKYINDTTDENFMSYSFLGKIKSLNYYLIKKESYNNEEYYLINKVNGEIIELIGYPFLSKNMNTIICVNNPSTDEDQSLQIVYLDEKKITPRFFNHLENKFLTSVKFCGHSIYAVDADYNYWKINMQ